jgi:hypothetical protein
VEEGIGEVMAMFGEVRKSEIMTVEVAPLG